MKLLRENRKSKVNEEISADITAYSKQYHRPLFIVYDLGYEEADGCIAVAACRCPAVWYGLSEQ